jgi:SAM-dependent methyltransferase
MSVIDTVHSGYVHTRRVSVLAGHIARLLAENASVLDVGCGDGLLATAISGLRPDVAIEGIDVMIRPGTHVPVTTFDGVRIPFADGAFDVVTFVDVLHHTDDPTVLLKEAARVARRAVIVKDHLLNGFLAGPTLRYMDRVGNVKHGVVLPFNYWPRAKWREVIQSLGLTASVWDERLRIYPWPADWLFGRSMHFVARLDVCREPVC